MGMKIASGTATTCQNYFKVIYNNTEHSLSEFANQYKRVDFSLDESIKDCIIVYRSKKTSCEELSKGNKHFSESLKCVERYLEQINPLEKILIISNMDYYKATKYIEKAEICLRKAKEYSMNSYNLLRNDFEFNWTNGYGSQFLLRTIDFTSAVLIYHSCFNELLRTVYFAFGIYKKMDGYTDQDSHKILLKRCSYQSMDGVYTRYKTVPGYKALWRIVNRCYDGLGCVNKWFNYIKYKGGISFTGLQLLEPFQIQKGCLASKDFVESTNKSSIELDVDDSLIELKKAHCALHDCMNELLDFIDFESAVQQIYNGKKVLVIPNREDYMKLILPK